MEKLRKWRKPALLLLLLVVAAQIGVSLLAQTTAVHNYFIRHLERSFGRSVEVRRFSALLLPAPVLGAEQITVGEDPAFGNEYFLRADHLTARLSWSELLRGHLEFGTLSFSRPSLILVHNEAWRWNLERWLPPPKDMLANSAALFYGPQLSATPANRLQKIEISEGRVDFKSGDDKLPFAFIEVSGMVEQVSLGRWRLELQARPWRSGVTLQSTGVLFVRGEVAGTSTRLQPAQIQVHWEDVSLADLFRLFDGQDHGVRGVLTLDGETKSAGLSAGAATNLQPGDWLYSVQARARQIHRWDLTERSDNPSINLNLDGRWNARARTATAERLLVQMPNSNLRGTAHIAAASTPLWELRVDSAGIQARDLLAWYRALYPDVDDGLSAEQSFTGAMTVRGWPVELQEAAFSSSGGELTIPGLDTPVKVGGFSGGRQRNRLVAGPLRLSYDTAARVDAKSSNRTVVTKRRSAPDNTSFVDVSLTHDFARRSGGITIEGHLDKVQDAQTFAAAFGHRLNHGWELLGPATAALHRDWDAISLSAAWNGRLDVTDGELQAAGLNQPLQINKARLEWNNGARTAQIAEIGAFGALWSGEIKQLAGSDLKLGSPWKFRLHANRLDATDLDRWVGPRARPNWLERMLPSLLGGLTSANNSGSSATELLRRVNAEGELRVDEFTLEKLTIDALRANVSLHDLRLDVNDVSTRWADGTVRAKLRATFLPQPSYDLTAQLERVNLGQLPAPQRAPERFGGVASGSLHLMTQGLGREELLQNLTGKGEMKLHSVEFNSWDVSASAAEGEPRAGTSRWIDGEGSFSIRDRGIILSGLRLESGPEITLVKGTVNFGQQADLTIQVATTGDLQSRTVEAQRVMRVSGPLDLPHISVEKVIARQPAD
jgi:AsmA-like C-terminal region